MVFRLELHASVFSFCIGFFEMVVGLKTYGPVVVVAYLPAVGDILVVVCSHSYIRNVQCVWLLYHFADCTYCYSCVVPVVFHAAVLFVAHALLFSLRPPSDLSSLLKCPWDENFIFHLFAFSCRIRPSYSCYQISILYGDWKYFFFSFLFEISRPPLLGLGPEVKAQITGSDVIGSTRKIPHG